MLSAWELIPPKFYRFLRRIGKVVIRLIFTRRQYSRILKDGAGNPVSDKYLLPLPFKIPIRSGVSLMPLRQWVKRKQVLQKRPHYVNPSGRKDVAERTDASQPILMSPSVSSMRQDITLRLCLVSAGDKKACSFRQ